MEERGGVGVGGVVRVLGVWGGAALQGAGRGPRVGRVLV